MKRALQALRSRLTLLTYLAGAGTIALGAALVFLPAGVIVGGLFLVGLVVELPGGRP